MSSPNNNEKLRAFQGEALREYSFAQLHHRICNLLYENREPNEKTAGRSFFYHLWNWSAFQRELALARLFEPAKSDLLSLPTAVAWLRKANFEVDLRTPKLLADIAAAHSMLGAGADTLWQAFEKRFHTANKCIDALTDYRSKVLAHSLEREPGSYAPRKYRHDKAHHLDIELLFGLALDFLELCAPFTGFICVWDGKLAAPGSDSSFRSLQAVLRIVQEAPPEDVPNISAADAELMQTITRELRSKYGVNVRANPQRRDTPGRR